MKTTNGLRVGDVYHYTNGYMSDEYSDEMVPAPYDYFGDLVEIRDGYAWLCVKFDTEEYVRVRIGDLSPY